VKRQKNKTMQDEQIMRNNQTMKMAENQQETKICVGKQIMRNKRTKETGKNQ
jgi:hypothetical protein